MQVAGLVPLVEAAAFTFGCAVLLVRWLDPDRVGIALALSALAVLLALMFALTPEGIGPDAQSLDPFMAWPQPT